MDKEMITPMCPTHLIPMIELYDGKISGNIWSKNWFCSREVSVCNTSMGNFAGHVKQTSIQDGGFWGASYTIETCLRNCNYYRKEKISSGY